jgi:hypothetical protein
MNRLLACVVFALLPAVAQPQEVTVQGYLKDLSGWTDQAAPTAGTEIGRFQNILHNRLNARYYLSSAWTFACDIRTRLILQEGFNRNAAFTSNLGGWADLADLSAILMDHDDVVLISQVDRLFADWTAGLLQLTIGRQRIAWGTNLIWNPTDLFNPFSVLDFDYEERPGVDGLRAQLFTGTTSKIEVAIVPGKTKRNRAIVGLVRLNRWDYDFNLMGGVFQDGYVFGLSWAGQVLDGGFRGEARWSGNQLMIDPVTHADLRRSYFTAAISGDYTFPNSLYLHTELLYNGDGATEGAGLLWAVAMARGQLSPGRWSIYQEVSGDLSPLLRGSVFGLVNPLDGSRIVVPSLNWSAATNWDLMLIAIVSGGEPRTEFAETGTSAFARVKWSF